MIIINNQVTVIERKLPYITKLLLLNDEDVICATLCNTDASKFSSEARCPTGPHVRLDPTFPFTEKTDFLSILYQMEVCLVQIRKENCHHDHIPFNVKGNGNIVFSV